MRLLHYSSLGSSRTSPSISNERGHHRPVWLAIPQFIMLVGIGVVLGVMLTTQQKVLVSVTDIETSLTMHRDEDMRAEARYSTYNTNRNSDSNDPADKSFASSVSSVLVSTFSSSSQPTFSTSNDDRQQQQQRNAPQIAWLQSFPNSGTSYTLRLVQRLTSTRTALNYGIEERTRLEPVLQQNSSIAMVQNAATAIDNNIPNYGPFWTHFDDDYQNYSRPTRFALTKTHCGGRCVSCYPKYYLQTMQSFRDSCLTTSWFEEQQQQQPGNPTESQRKLVEGTYPIEDVGKSVHVFRNPYDNVVSRYHNYRFNENIPGPGTREEFRTYCWAVNNKTIASERLYTLWGSRQLLDILKDVPCKSDFFKYTQWHNLAFATTDDNAIETLPLYYEDFIDTKFNHTVDRLLKFVELERSPDKNKPSVGILPFVHGKSYLDHFTDYEKDRIRQGIELMATRKTWRHIRHYFEDENDEDDVSAGDHRGKDASRTTNLR